MPSDDLSRHPYRFGEEILSCKECVTQRDFLARGLIQSLGFHIVSGGATHYSLVISRQSSRSSSALLHHHLSTRDTRFSLYCSLHASHSNTFVSFIKYVASLLFLVGTSFVTMLSLQLFMFFSIAVSRVAPVLFPDASDDSSSLFLAQNAAAILEKVKTVDRERKSVTILLSSVFLSQKFHP